MDNSALFFLLCLLTATTTPVIAEDDEECSSDKFHLPAIRLNHDLLCGYDPTIRPVLNHQNATEVDVKMIVKLFSFAEETNSFRVDAWLALVWKDHHLKWKPQDYSGIESTHLSTDEIWKPDVSVFNRDSESGSAQTFDTALCLSYYIGSVICIVPARLTSLCVPDMTLYPFDSQTCTIRLGSWVHNGEEIDLNFDDPAFTVSDMVQNGLWSLSNTKAIKHVDHFQCCPNTSHPYLDFIFKIERQTKGQVATVVLPAVTLILLTLTSLWINPANPDRMLLCCVNFICELLYGQFIAWLIPNHGEKIALIALFSRDSTVLSAFTIFLTCALNKLVSNKKREAPLWIAGPVSLVISNRIGQFIFLRDSSLKGVAAARGEEDGDVIVEANAEIGDVEEIWDILAKILDVLSFVAFCIVYFCMVIAFTQ